MTKTALSLIAFAIAALSASAQIRQDVNGDGKVNSADVVAIYNYIIHGGDDKQPVATKMFNVNGVSFNMVSVKGGTFMMLSEDSEFANNGGIQVTLSSYMIGQTEVTQELWEAVMGSKGRWWASAGLGAKYPAYGCSWKDWQAFIQKLNELTGQNFRMPTEAEWEFAARGGNLSKGYLFAGSNDIDAVAWYNDNSSRSAQPVATKAPNELGIYDMSGNVREVCSDWLGKLGYDPMVNPTGPEYGSERVVRGGACVNQPDGCRITHRMATGPSDPISDQGLRLAL